MFWKHNNTSSPQFEAVLQKEGVTLQELMEEDEIIQECKSQNKKLIEFLCQRNILEELVTLITEEPSEEFDEKFRFKYPKIACELLTCDVPALNESLSRDNELLEKLYSFIDKEPPLNPLLASFLSRTLSVLIVKRIDQHWISYQVTCLQAMGFLKDKENFISLLLKHLGTSAIMDLTLKLITEVGDQEHRQNILNWLDSQRLIQSLVALFDPKVDSEIHHNASQLLCDVLRISRDGGNDRKRTETDPIITRLEAPETVSLLLDRILGEEKSDSSIFGGIQVLLALLGYKNSFIDNNVVYNNDNDEVEIERIKKVTQSTSLVILTRLKDFHQILIDPPTKRSLNTSIGTLDPPLGNIRLQVTKLLAALIAADNSDLLREIMNLGTVEVLLDLFFKYAWNNFLHTQVQQCIAAALTAHVKPNESEHETSDNLMYPYLFIKCRLINRILEAWKDNEQKQFKPKGIRQGYMGHLINIANDIVSQCQKNSTLDKYISESVSKETLESWKSFVNNSLAETNMMQQIVLGGFHPAFLSNDEIEDAMYQIYTDFQMPEIPPEIMEKIGLGEYDPNNMDDSIDPPLDRTSNLNIANEIDLSRQAELFRRVCSGYINTLDDADDTIFDESAAGIRTGKLPMDDSWDPRGCNNSDEDDDMMLGSGSMQLDSDPWSSLDTQTTTQLLKEPSDPWTNMESSTKPTTGDDCWADFGSFATSFDDIPTHDTPQSSDTSADAIQPAAGDQKVEKINDLFKTLAVHKLPTDDVRTPHAGESATTGETSDNHKTKSPTTRDEKKESEHQEEEDQKEEDKQEDVQKEEAQVEDQKEVAAPVILSTDTDDVSASASSNVDICESEPEAPAAPTEPEQSNVSTEEEEEATVADSV